MAFRSGFSSRPRSSGVFPLLIALGLGFILSFGLTSSGVPALFGSQLETPWGILTYPLAYPFAGSRFIAVIFTLLWIYYAYTALESTLGRWGVIWHFVAFQVLFGLFGFLAESLLASDYALFGPFIPAEALVILWAAVAPNSTISLFGVLPVKMLYIGLISTGTILFFEGALNPMIGVIMVIPAAIVWLYGLGKLPGLAPGSIRPRRSTKKQNKEWDSYYSKVKTRQKEREERERLKKLFEDSMGNSDSDKK